MTPNTRRARLVMFVGAILLALAAGLTLWDLSADNDGGGPAPITGDVDSP